ncbi:hypothetical protein P170DRAFT_440084 [Aspergillus steynii IBT 23096]|uniref:Uncharacterized protein n=1 Tax=Aspergillus steynii IBT 23096 TaxID=1392250 RepID=A0A2I2FW91_9EURO|nr:uncharacterized protein P170DRAFT_440084 [Aspergillus steynii IBT 23096]PLB44877.1 hypothetical protein P170DRAFT_440084 [Aspergillus steynii IBT 23096]
MKFNIPLFPIPIVSQSACTLQGPSPVELGPRACLSLAHPNLVLTSMKNGLGIGWDGSDGLVVCWL